MRVQYVPKPSLIPPVLPIIERFMEENNQTLLPPRLLLQRTRIRNVALCGICCISYIIVYQHIFLTSNTNSTTLLKVPLYPYETYFNHFAHGF